jgi:raffinose/stachyose/melibiose transport system substrate-binding protein
MTWTGGGMIEYIKSNLIIPLTRYMEAPYNGLSRYRDYFMGGGISQATYQNDIWAVPGTNASILLVWYNKRVFNRLGIQVPVTFAELEAACDKMVANGVVPFALANKAKYPASFWYMLLATRYGGSGVYLGGQKNAGMGQERLFPRRV